MDVLEPVYAGASDVLLLGLRASVGGKIVRIRVGIAQMLFDAPPVTDKLVPPPNYKVGKLAEAV